MIGTAEINRRLTCHAPEGVEDTLDAVTNLVLCTANKLDALLPDGREQQLAFKALEDLRHYAIAAVVRPPSEAPWHRTPAGSPLPPVSEDLQTAEAQLRVAGGCCKEEPADAATAGASVCGGGA